MFKLNGNWFESDFKVSAKLESPCEACLTTGKDREDEEQLCRFCGGIGHHTVTEFVPVADLIELIVKKLKIKLDVNDDK